VTKRHPDWSLGAFLAGERNVQTSGGRSCFWPPFSPDSRSERSRWSWLSSYIPA